MPALDGLRGLAVAAVLVYHAESSWLPGGMLGVTVFFTLSGFLITSLLLGELEETGTVDLRAFWMRRARRLVPASIAAVALVAVLVAVGWPGATSQFIGDAASAMTWTANWRFAADAASYESLFQLPSPFQHFWSLAVEEQVYLILPVVALALLGRHGRHRLRFAAFLVAGIASSTYLAASTHVAGEVGGRAYYATDARIAEPLVGALIALALARGGAFARFGAVGRRAADIAGSVALVVVGLLATQLSVADSRLYRGGFLLTAALAAVVLVAATQPTAIARLLSARPLARLGTISYGVYLFHWPIYIWLGERMRGSHRFTVVAAEIGATVALASVSHALLELPIRRRSRGPARIFAAGWASASVAALAGLVVVTVMPSPHPDAGVDLGVDDAGPEVSVLARPPTLAAAWVNSNPAEATILAREADWRAGRVGAPPDRSRSQTRIAVVGDSLAHNLANGLAAWAEGRGDVVVYDLSVAFCPLSRGGNRRWEGNEVFPVSPKCAWWDDPSSERAANLAAFAPTVVVVEAGFSEMLDRRRPEWDRWRGPGDDRYHQWLLDEYAAMTAARAIAGTDTSVVGLNVPCGDFSRLRGWRRVTEPDDRVRALNREVYQDTSSTTGDLFAQLCPDGHFTDELWGIPDARPDGIHLTDEAATELARRWLGPLVLAVGSPAQPVRGVR